MICRAKDISAREHQAILAWAEREGLDVFSCHTLRIQEEGGSPYTACLWNFKRDERGRHYLDETGHAVAQNWNPVVVQVASLPVIQEVA